MSSTKAAVSTNAQAADPQAPSSPTTTFYQQIAAQLGASVNQSVEQIPGYHDDLSALGKRSRRLVTPKFISMTVTAVEASDELTGVKQLDVEQTRDSGQFSEAFQPLVDQLKSLTNRLELMMKAKEVKAGRGALAIYNIAKRLVKDTNNTHLAVHVANLKAELNRKRPGRKSRAKPPATPPATPVATVVEGAKGGGQTK